MIYVEKLKSMIDSNVPEDDIVYYMFELIDDLIETGRFEEVDNIFDLIIENFDEDYIFIGMLTVTLIYKHKLSNREKFFNDVENKLKTRYSLEETKEILNGLQ